MKKQLVIQNLKCGGCAHTIKTELNKIDGVSGVSIDENTSTVSFNTINDDISKVINRLDSLGYPIEANSNRVLKKAKSYVSCAIGRINND